MKKEGIFYFLFLLLTSTILIGCDDDKDEKFPKKISFKEIKLSDYTQDQSICLFSKEDTVYVINNNADLNKIAIYKNGEEVDFNIDYTKNSLLIIHGHSLSGISKIEKTILQQNKQNYLLDIQILQNVASVVEPWAVLLSVPKIDSKVNTSTNIQYSIYAR